MRVRRCTKFKEANQLKSLVGRSKSSYERDLERGYMHSQWQFFVKTRINAHL